MGRLALHTKALEWLVNAVGCCQRLGLPFNDFIFRFQKINPQTAFCILNSRQIRPALNKSWTASERRSIQEIPMPALNFALLSKRIEKKRRACIQTPSYTLPALNYASPLCFMQTKPCSG